MAQFLTWRDVAAPDFSGAQNSINSAARLFDAATKTASTGIAAFDQTKANTANQQALINSLKYSDSAQYQQALASGSMLDGIDTSRLDPATLTALAKRPTTLLDNAATALAAERDGTALDIARQDRVRSVNQRADQEAWATDLAKYQTGGQLTGEANANALYGTAVRQERSPAYLAAMNSSFKGMFPGSFGVPLEAQLGSPAGGTPTASANSTTAISSFGSSAAAPKFSPELSEKIAAREKASGLPAGVLASVIQQETGANEEYLKDPAKYHYAADANGKRVAPKTGAVSTAFGPFGLLESTAAKPGYGVAPLQNKSIDEQLRFAGDYLAARIKEQGGSVERGLDSYGTGVGTGYGASVLRRTPTAADLRQAAATVSAATTLANASSGSSDAQRLLSVAAESQGKDNSLARVTKELTGKDGDFSQMNPSDVERNLIYVQGQLKVNGSVAAELLKMAGGNTDRSLNILGEGPWITKSINKDRLQALVENYKQNGKFLQSLNTGEVYKENNAAAVNALAQADSRTARLQALESAARRGVPGAESFTTEAAQLRDSARTGALNQLIENARVAEPNMVQNPLPARPVATESRAPVQANVPVESIPAPPPQTRQVGLNTVPNPAYLLWDKQYGDAYRASQVPAADLKAQRLKDVQTYNPYVQNRVR